MIYPFSNEYKIILGSASPRRKQLLEGLGLEFSVWATNADESFDAELPPELIAMNLSAVKARTFDGMIAEDPGLLVITADTIVSLEGQILNKPAGKEEAREMLHLLSGKSHQVITGVTLTSRGYTKTFSETTEVHFLPLDPPMIDYYIDHFQPFDKAGGYGIQEWIGFAGVAGISGCYYNVMGLPLAHLFGVLREFYEEHPVKKL